MYIEEYPTAGGFSRFDIWATNQNYTAKYQRRNSQRKRRKLQRRRMK